MKPDCVRMLISMSSSIALSKLAKYIGGKSSRKLSQEFEQLRKKLLGSTPMG
ncbi:transposase [Wolbachia pipientis]|uniref:transposase n=1 Tax=Wolbachia pipientis TaxID=955 RepID=UPI00345EF030